VKKSKLAKKAKHRKVVARKAAPRKVVRKVAKKRAVRKATPMSQVARQPRLETSVAPSRRRATGLASRCTGSRPASGRRPPERRSFRGEVVSRRVFVNVRRGPMDNTAVCVFPWEIDILQHIHMQEVKEVSIDEMANQKDGVVKVEKLKLKHTKLPAPDLRSQLEMMAYVDPKTTRQRPGGRVQRLADKYGMDKDLPMPVRVAHLRRIQLGRLRGEAEAVRQGPPADARALKALDEGLGQGARPDVGEGAARRADRALGAVEGDRGQGGADREARRGARHLSRCRRASTRRWGNCARTCGRCLGRLGRLGRRPQHRDHRHAPAQRPDAPVLEPRLGAPAPLRDEAARAAAVPARLSRTMRTRTASRR
jgi:hypothetical protein